MSELDQVLDVLFDPIGQGNRLLKLDTALGSDIFLPHRVHGVDRVSKGFDYTADILSLDSNVELKQLIAQEVTLWILQTDSSYLPIHGYVHTARKLGSDGQLTAYQIAFSSFLHFLKFRKDARIWQDKDAEEIITEILDGHPQCRGRFKFELDQPARSRSYCTQFETDWHFLMRIMESEGWYGYFRQFPDGTGHELIITDSVQSLSPTGSEEIAFHRAGRTDELNRIVQWGAERGLISSGLATRTFDYKNPGSNNEHGMQVFPEHGSIPSQLEVYEYTGPYTNSDADHGNDQSRIRVQEWESRAKRFFGTSGVRSLPVCSYFTLDDHPAHDEVAVEPRQFVVLQVEWAIENNLPLSGRRKEFSGSLQSALQKFEAEAGLAEGVRLRREGNISSSGHCFNRFEVQRRLVEYRSPFSHAKPVSLPADRDSCRSRRPRSLYRSAKSGKGALPLGPAQPW